MSKKCCGIIYKDEKFCTLCGKPLQDVLDMEEVEKIAASVRGEEAAPKELEEAKEDVKEEIKEEVKEESKEEPKEEAKTPEEAAVDGIEKSSEAEENAEDKVEESSKDEADDEDEEDEDDEDEDDGTASGGLKFFGTLMILLMIASIVAVGLGVYFIMLNPFYKNHDINKPVVYEQMSTDTDVTNIQTRPVLTSVALELATPEDATTETVTTDTDATETDATDEEASEDME